MTRYLETFTPLIEEYDLFLVDQWGVLHNGAVRFQEAARVLQQLKARGKKVIILSNSASRASYSAKGMSRMGLPPSLYDHMITSGEAVHRALKDRTLDLGETFYLLPLHEAHHLIASGTPYREVAHLEDADFILCAGIKGGDLSSFEDLIETALSRSMPFVCANPDRVSLAPSGVLDMCPGTLAEVYEARGGQVIWFGKPEARMYHLCQQLEPSCTSCLAVGDSLLHDIQGGAKAGFDTLFITRGVHVHEVSQLTGDPISRVGHLSRTYGVPMPTYAMDCLTDGV